MEFRFFHLILLFVCVLPSDSAFISAFNPNFQIRTGKLFVAFQNNILLSGPTNINYHTALPSASIGVFFGLKSYRTNQSNQIQYSFSSTSLTLVGFQFVAVFPNNITIIQIFVDYFSTAQLNYVSLYQLSNVSLQGQNNIGENTTTYIWTINENWIVSFQQSHLISISSFLSTKIVIPAGVIINFQFRRTKSSSLYQILLVMRLGTQVSSNTKLCTILYCKFCQRGQELSYTLQTTQVFFLSSSAVNLKDISFPSFILSLAKIIGTSTRLMFKISFDNQYISNSSYFYLQQNIQQPLRISFSGATNISFNLIHPYRKNCNDQINYPYLVQNTQYCYDICPLKSFPNSDNICKNCLTFCRTNIENCNFCYQNGCESNYYFDTEISPFECTLCSLKIINCTNCLANSSGVFCTICSSSSHTQLVDGSCIPCNLTSYFQQTDKICLSCQSKFSGCQRCSSINGDTCLQCLVSSQKQLYLGTCIQCNSSSYFDPSQKKCIICQSAVPNCIYCTYSVSEIICSKCNNMSMTELVLNVCQYCNISSYYYSLTQQCILCQLSIPNCERCSSPNGLICDLCYDSSQTIIFQGNCVPCSVGTYFQLLTKSCLSCPSNCKICSDSTNCIQCLINFQLIDNNCQPLQLMIYNSFSNEFKNNRQIISTILLTPAHNRVLIDYSMEVYINNVLTNFSIISQNQQSIMLNIPFFKSMNTPKISIKFLNLSSFQYLQNQILEQTMKSISYISQKQQNVYLTLDQGMDLFSLNFQYLFAGTTLTATTMYFISFIWSFQILSLYVFIQIQMPQNFKRFMKAMSRIQNVNLLPVNIQNPMDQIQYNFQPRAIYQQLEVDLFFIRSNLIKWIQTSIYILIYTIIYLILFKIKSESFIFRFLKRRFVKTFISNIAVLLYSLIIDQAFSASITLSYTKLSLIQDIFNYISGILGLLLIILLITLTPIYLYIKKKQRNIDTQDAYIGISRIKHFGQIGVLIFGLLNIFVCICIPNQNPMFSLLLIIFSIVMNMGFHLKLKCMKVKALLVFRMLHHGCFILFNLVCIIFAIGYKYFPKTDIKFFEVVGYFGMGSFVSAILFQFCEGLVQIGKDFYQFVKRQISKWTLRNTLMQSDEVILQQKHLRASSYVDSIIQSEVKPNEKKSNTESTMQSSKMSFIKTNYRRRCGFILKKAPKINLHNSKSRLTMQEKNIYQIQIKKQKQLKRMKSQRVQNFSQ